MKQPPYKCWIPI